MAENITVGYARFRDTMHPKLEADIVSEVAELFSASRREVFRRAAAEICPGSDGSVDYDVYEKNSKDKRIPQYVLDFCVRIRTEDTECGASHCSVAIKGVRRFTRVISGGAVLYYCSPQCMGLAPEVYTKKQLAGIKRKPWF